jgi:hypothetical protein
MTAADIARALGGRRSGRGWIARCPVHDDSRPSLSINEGDDGKVLVRCHAGCPQEAVISALKERGLWSKPVFANPSSTGLSLAKYAKAKQLPVEFLLDLGIREETYRGETRLRIPYYDTDGSEVAIRYRNRTGFYWRSGDKAIPYGLQRLVREKPSVSAVVVEGESDAQTLWYHGFTALGIPGATTWKDEWASYLDSIERVYAVIEPDQGGEQFLRCLANSPLRKKLYLIDLDGVKDVSELYLSDTSAFVDRFRQALDRAVPFQELEAQERAQRSKEALDRSRDLREDPRLLQRIEEAIRQQGYAGCTRVPLLVYLAATSRLLDRPFNLCVVAPSGAGKTRAVKAGLSLIPEEFIYQVDASSSTALIYTDEDFAHRVIFMAEADSIPQVGPAASALRSLLTENKLQYEVAEKDPETGQFVTRRISKSGPTVLITTSTRPFEEQMRTRSLELHLLDTPDQTRAVMHSHAAAAAGEAAQVDLEPFHNLQDALAQAGRREVVIPYARALAEAVPADDVRMRRHFEHLLSCIQTIAFLFQWQRQVDEQGRVIATLDDYAMAKELLDPTFGAIVRDELSPAVRQTVEAIGEGEEVSQVELARRLGVSSSTISWRVRQALRGKWLVNLETRKGREARLARGAQLPEPRPILPSVEEVQAFYSNIQTPPQTKHQVRVSDRQKTSSDHSNTYSKTSERGKTPSQSPDMGEVFESSNDFWGDIERNLKEIGPSAESGKAWEPWASPLAGWPDVKKRRDQLQELSTFGKKEPPEATTESSDEASPCRICRRTEGECYAVCRKCKRPLKHWGRSRKGPAWLECPSCWIFVKENHPALWMI